MPVLLRRSDDLPPHDSYDSWFAVTGAHGRGRDGRKLPNLARRLENTFDWVRDEWWALAAILAEGRDAELSFAATCAGYGSELGLMLAWKRLTEETAADAKTRTLVICDDPWLFREMAGLSWVRPGPVPALALVTLRLLLRGILARVCLALRLAWTVCATRRQRAAFRPGDAAILVYCHPRSTADGYDDYFGPLMREMPDLKRVLHTDCGAGGAKALAADGRTASLHAWAKIGWLPGLLFRRWRPKPEHLTGRHGWLVRRAAVIEGGGAGHAMNAWQRHCQEAWLAAVKPAVVAWPWENLGWERAFCRSARRLGVTSIGYQHTVIGPQQLNYSPAANADGEASLPDLVLCDGPAYRDQLIEWGVPEERLKIGGSLRLEPRQNDLYDPAGPVFVALSGLFAIADQQIDAARRIAATGRRVLIKEHPMYPLRIEETDTISKTDRPLAQQSGLSAVLYSTGTSGLEALLAGLPAVRLLLEDRIALSVLPEDITIAAATKDDIADAIAHAEKPEHRDWTRILAPVDMGLWRSALAGADRDPGEK